jgi:uncharacterized protein (TIGR03790 family)
VACYPRGGTAASIRTVTRLTHRRALSIVSALVVALAVTRPARAELRADELVLIVNSNEPAGMALAQFYARARHVPDNRILVLDLPTTDDITPQAYATQVVPQVRAFLHSGGLEAKVRCLVPFYGVPLRIAARVNTPAELTEIRSAVEQLAALAPAVKPAIEAVEGLGKRLDPTFEPGTGQTIEDLDRRWAAALQKVRSQLPTIPDGRRREEVTREMFVDAAPLLGRAADINAKQIDLGLHPERRADESPPLQAEAAAYNQSQADAERLEQLPEDAAARDQLRTLVRAEFGLAQYARLLRDQCDYLDARHGGMAFDSELALVRWTVHFHNFVSGNPYAGGAAPGRTHWFANPLFYGAGRPVGPSSPTMMVVRLDGPTPAIVKTMIATGLRAEANGLHGRIVIDSLGYVPGQEPEGKKGYGVYDQTLRELRNILSGRPAADVMFDGTPDLLPAHAADNVALYCGWYAVNGYVPCCDFASGAVAMHVASYTLTTLRQTPNPNWAVGLLDDGVAATIGPVQEPFLFAFPRADDFFPLLLTGKLTLAECYWRTEPVASWQMTCVGDPLYTPYRTNPMLTVADLPLRLRGLFRSAPTTGSATGPIPSTR